MMIRRIVQLELAARQRAQFALEAGHLNHAAVTTARAQHERHLTALATAYRIGRASTHDRAPRGTTPPFT